MKKNGFTLIEILAVVVLIGLLTVLVVSKIKPSISDSKKSIAFSSASSIVTRFEEYYFEQKVSGNFLGCTYDFDNSINGCNGFSFAGDKPTGGSVTIDSNGNINGVVYFGKYGYEINDNKILEDNIIIDGIIGIEIASLPSQKIYNVGESLNVEGLKVIANWTSGEQKEIDDYTIIFDSSSKGEKEVVIEYMGYSASFNVDVANVKYLYKNGDLCSDITGGWTNNIGTRNSYWYNYNVSFNSDHILFKEEDYYGNWAQSATRTQKMIDFSLYDELYVDFYIDGPVEYHFFSQISSSTSLDNTPFLLFSDNGRDSEGRYTRNVNISNYNSSAYLKINLMTGTERPTVVKNSLKLYNVYLIDN